MSTTKIELRARDVMTTEPVTVTPSATIRQFARVLEENEISGVPVVDQSGRLVGVVSQTDLIRRCSEGTVDIAPAYLFEVLGDQGGEDEDEREIIPEAAVCVEDFMTDDPITVTPDTPAGEVARRMSEAKIHRVVVIDPGNFPVGIITSLDLLRVFPR